MKLVQFSKDTEPEVGLVSDGIISISKHLPLAPRQLVKLIEVWDEFAPTIAALCGKPADLQINEVHLLPPISRPSKILGIGLNYQDHVEESGMAKPTDQLWFLKAASAVAGPFDPIRLPRVSRQLDYEAELVVVIGKRCRYADRSAAKEAIFGYCAGNDVSIRDWQFKTSQFMLGKSFDSHAPHGPWIVPKDSIDPLNLNIQCYVNDEVRQHSNTRNLIFDPIAQVMYLSQVMTLEPGDLLFTGTPGGVGAARKPPVWLKEGDRVRVAIEGIGEIENRVVSD